MKWLIAVVVLFLGTALLAHGVVLPRFIWEPRLQAIQHQYPDQTIQVKRVVLAISINPQLMLSEVEIDALNLNENLKLGLLKLRFNGVDSIQKWRLQIDSIELKGLQARAEKQADCSTLNSDCLTLLPLALGARAWQGTQAANPSFFTPELALKHIEIEQAVFNVSNPQAKQHIAGKLPQFKFQRGDGNVPAQLYLGWEVNIQTPEKNNEAYASVQAKPKLGPKRELVLTQLKVNGKGHWGGFPWTGIAEQDLLALQVEQANHGTGAPLIKINGEKLRMYLRRDDLPETHQAAFSAQQIEGGLPAQNWTFKKAEWTYTHENAQAWTFNMNYNAVQRLLELQGETIEGSEGRPAETQSFEINCTANTNTTPTGKPYWAWQNGWFSVLAEHPSNKASLVLCPVQSSLVGK